MITTTTGKPGKGMTMIDLNVPDLHEKLIDLKHFSVQLSDRQLFAMRERLKEVLYSLDNERDKRKVTQAIDL